jgi:hypothetical protein
MRRLQRILAMTLLTMTACADTTLAGALSRSTTGATSDAVRISPVANDLASIPSGSQITSVSCTASNECVAVGADLNADPLLLVGSPSNWSAAQATAIFSPILHEGGALSSVFCLSATECVAEGYADSGQILTLYGNPHTWNASRLHSFKGPPSVTEFNSLTCTSPQFCVAVGTSANLEPVTLAGDPKTWGLGQMTEQPLATPLAGSFTGVQCFSETKCVAVGDSANDGLDHPIVLVGNPMSWTGQAISTLDISDGTFTSISPGVPQ